MTWEEFERRLIAHGYATGTLRLKLIRQMRMRHPIVCDLNPPAWYELVVKDLDAGVVLFTSQALRRAMRQQRARASGDAAA
jgi:hypothetical protein